MSFRGTITGRVGRKPEPKPVGDNRVAELSVATNQRTKNGEETLWVKVEAWGQQCDYACRFLDKGSFIVAHGDIWAEEFTKRNGELGFATVVKSAKIEGVKEQQAAQAPAPLQTQQNFPAESPHQAAMTSAPAPAPAASAAAPSIWEGAAAVPQSDDIPF